MFNSDNCRQTVSYLVALISLVAFSTGAVAAPGSISKRTVQALNDAIPNLMLQANVPGLSLALIRDGKVFWIRDFGAADRATGSPVTHETTFEAASLGKVVFAYAVMKLVDQHKLDLDAPLQDYLQTPYIDGDTRLSKITARLVLSHRTGFPNWRPSGGKLTINFPPGDHFSYSGEGFLYLQRVVETITGMPLNEYMQQAVFSPLKLTSSSYVWRADFDAHTAVGYNADGSANSKWKPKDAVAASTLQTTARDYARFVAALLSGTGLSHTSLADMESAQTPVSADCVVNCFAPKSLVPFPDVAWGLGTGLEEIQHEKAIWHWGDNGSFKAYMLGFPAQRSGFVMFTNSENGLAIANVIARMAFGYDRPGLKWLQIDAQDSPSMLFGAAVREIGLSLVIELHRQSLMTGEVSERCLDSLGHWLLGQKKLSDGLRLLQLNAQLHPQSARSLDGLADAYLATGDKAASSRSFQEALKLDPADTNAIRMLKELP